MPVVTDASLRRFMSNPRWSPEQTQVAADLCAQVESSLEAALGGTRITPVPRTETANILARTGLVDTDYPVHAVQDLDGVTVADGDPLPDGWTLDNHRLSRGLTSGTNYPSLLTLPSVTLSGLNSWGTGISGNPYSSIVTLTYLAGWGPEPALVNAILRKAAAFMQNRHSDVVVAVGLDAAAAPSPAPETWTVDELSALGRFRRLAMGAGW